MKDEVQLGLVGFQIPEDVRLCEQVPDSECHNCRLNTQDHTIGMKFPVPYYGNYLAYEKVCIKDWRRTVRA